MRILVAHDEAFNFIYRANVDALARLGTVSFFSPLADSHLPACDLLYLPGGYPELYAERLSANASMLAHIADYAREGGRIFAECGGFMYLCDSIDGRSLVGVFPMQATMRGAHLHLGYRQMTVEGHDFRGHEFHYSSFAPCPLPPDITTLRLQADAQGKPVSTELFLRGRVLAGYTHWYWADKDSDTLWLLLGGCCGR